MTVINPTDRWTTGDGASFENYRPLTEDLEYDPPIKAIYVGTAGTLVAENRSGDTINITNLTVGWHYIVIRKVLAASTIADASGWW